MESADRNRGGPWPAIEPSPRALAGRPGPSPCRPSPRGGRPGLGRGPENRPLALRARQPGLRRNLPGKRPDPRRAVGKRGRCSKVGLGHSAPQDPGWAQGVFFPRCGHDTHDTSRGSREGASSEPGCKEGAAPYQAQARAAPARTTLDRGSPASGGSGLA